MTDRKTSVRVIRGASGRKVISADDWRARTESDAIMARMDALRARLKSEADAQSRSALAAAFARAEGLRSKALRRDERHITELALICAKKLAESELLQSPESIRNVVASVLELAVTSGPVALRVHPSVRPALHDVTGLPIRDDEELSPLDCVVEVRDGEFDGRFEIRLARLRAALATFDREFTAADDTV